MTQVRLATVGIAGAVLVGATAGEAAAQREWVSGRRRGDAAAEWVAPAPVMAAPVDLVDEAPAEPEWAWGAVRVALTARRMLANHNADLDAPVDVESVQRAILAWKVETGANVSHRPLVERGRAYIATWGGEVLCVDVATGREVWRSKLGEPRLEWPVHGFVGTGAIGEGLLLEASAEGKAYGIDLETGETVWEADIAEDEHAGNHGSLLYHEGIVYIGLASVEDLLTAEDPELRPNFRGRVLALRARSGEVVWKADLVRAPSNGVPVASGFALDPDLGILYFTTGHNYTGRPSLLSDSLVAVDAASGDLLWRRQTTPNDAWTPREPVGPGFGFTAPPQLFEAAGGELRLVGAGEKSGVYHVWDRRRGEPVWRTTLGYGNIGGGFVAGASVGRDRLLMWSNGSYAYRDPLGHPMDVAAVEIATGRYVWVSPEAQPAMGGIGGGAGFLAGDVYFVPSLDGRIRAYSAAGGREVWTSPAHAAVASSVVVEGDLLLFGTGVPPGFGGPDSGERGVYAYRLGGADAKVAGVGVRVGTDASVRPAALRERRKGRNLEREGHGTEVGRRVRIDISGMRFQPEEIRAEPGERLRVELSNRSTMRHGIDFALPGGSRGLGTALEADELAELVVVAPEQPGEYEFYCPLHKEQMRGKLIVTDGADRRPRNSGGAR